MLAFAAGQYLRDQRAGNLAATSAPVTADAVARADAALSEGRFEDAVNLYIAVLATEPDNAEALGHLGWTLAETGSRTTGLQLIEQSLAMRHDSDIAAMRDQLLTGEDPTAPANTEQP